MPEQLSFDLKQLVRVCLNDPDLRAEIFAAIDAGPLPVRTPVATVKDGETTFSAIIKVNREKSPGEDGFVSRDNLGWLTARLSEVVSSAPDASTMSADQVASQMGITTDELLKKK
ncbi:MAG: hypothetical protein QM831_23560 [Kofleriaceae bacterium]